MSIFRSVWPRTFLLLAPLVAVATSLPGRGQAAPSAGTEPADMPELEVFLDGLLSGLVADRHVPGAVVLGVKDGAVLFSKGYGVADLVTGCPVDPDPPVTLPLSPGLPYFWVQAFVTHTWTALEQLRSLALLLAAGLVAVFVWYRNLLGVVR